MVPSRDVVLFSTADWDNPSWTNKQHMACELAGRGFRILYVESLGLRAPSMGRLDLGRMLRRLGKGLLPLKKARDGIHVLSPLVLPFHSKSWMRLTNNLLLERGVKGALKALGMHDPILWTYHPFLPKIPQSQLVYHCVDDLAAAPHMPSERLREAEANLVREADVVFATSRLLQKHCGSKAHYLPNVVDFDHFSQAQQPGPLPADLEAIPRPRIGFVGAVSEYKVDFDLIARSARLRPDWHWVLVGPIGEGQPSTRVDLLRQANIHLLGHKPYSELPSYLRGFDAATLFARENDYTKSMFPMKFFEYLAAGLPVVANHVPALDEFRQAFQLASTPEQVIQALESILAFPNRHRAKNISLAKQHTWAWRTDRMLEILSDSPARRQFAA